MVRVPLAIRRRPGRKTVVMLKGAPPLVAPATAPASIPTRTDPARVKSVGPSIPVPADAG
jgi:hypothetical protein